MNMRNTKFVLLMSVCIMMLACAAQSGVIQTQPPVQVAITVEGTISAINYDLGAITILPPQPPAGSAMPSPAPVKFFVNDKTRIEKNGQLATLKALLVGDICKASLVKAATGLYALAITAQTPQQLRVVSGKIEKIDASTNLFALRFADATNTNAASAIMYFFADKNTKIIKNGKPAMFVDLCVGDIAKVGFVVPPPTLIPVNKPIRAITIEAITPPEMIGYLTGRILKIDAVAKRIAVAIPETASVKPLIFQITDRTSIIKIGEAKFESLMVGDKVEMAFIKVTDGRVPVAISVKVIPEVFTGPIIKIDKTTGWFALAGSSVNSLMSFKAIPNVVVVKNGKTVGFGDLALRDSANVTYFRFADANAAVSILAKSPVIITK